MPRVYKHKYSSASVVAALTDAKSVAAAARAIGAKNNGTFTYRAKTDPAIGVALAACRARSKKNRLSALRKLQRDPRYNRDAVAKVLRHAPSIQAAADELCLTPDDLAVAASLAPKSLRPLYNACRRREPRRNFTRKITREQLMRTLRGAPSIKSATDSLGIHNQEIFKVISRHPDAEIAALLKEVGARGRALGQAKVVAYSAAKGSRAGKVLKAEFCFRDYVGKFARLRRDLVTGKGRGATYPKGTRFKVVKHAHHSFSIVRVDEAGHEIEADNAWGRYFIAGVTRNKLDFEEAASA